jgi:hypothetical protein
VIFDGSLMPGPHPLRFRVIIRTAERIRLLIALLLEYSGFAFALSKILIFMHIKLIWAISYGLSIKSRVLLKMPNHF